MLEGVVSEQGCSWAWPYSIECFDDVLQYQHKLHACMGGYYTDNCGSYLIDDSSVRYVTTNNSLGRGGFGTGLLVFMIGVAVQQCFEDALAERRTHWLRTSIDGSKLLLAVRLI